MRRVSYWPYLFLLIFFFSIFNISKPSAEGVRYAAVASLSPLWQGFNSLKKNLLAAVSLPSAKERRVSKSSRNQIALLQQENALLQSQLEQVREWLLSEERVQQQFERLQFLGKAEEGLKDFFKRRAKELSERIHLQTQSLPACVIFREPVSWSSALWIDVGEKENKRCGKKVISKNSPVLFGASLVGVIEYVGEHRSRVRLITDAHLVPSVRVVRGKEQNRSLLEHLDALLLSLTRREELFSSPEERNILIAQLSSLSQKLAVGNEERYLAKGEIFGSSAPLWRSRSQTLKGFGFNYDFADEEGLARDLRTGEPLNAESKKEAVVLLKNGDLLVTTGFDGIFPAGYPVAIVSKVQSLKEGASCYEIEAVATAGNLDEISHVVVLPALEIL